ncbi:MAG: hypothetical protein Q8R15_01950 [Candidatus Micrarchaeota archaeon]|nr:hypothetical protein [Candidatus Micrarchaeota archaeon]
MPLAVVLDTNFLLLPFQRQIDLETGIETLLEEPHFFVVLQQVMDELTEIASKQRRFSPAARAAISFVSKKGFVIEKGFPGVPDNALVQYCKAKEAVLCTLDTELRRKAKNLGVRVIFLRDKGHLAQA